MVICLEWGADLHMVQLMPLPLTVSCFSKIQIGFTFLVPAHLGCPGQRAVKRVCVCVCVEELRDNTSKDSKQTEMIWSPARSLPSRAAAPPSITLEMNTDYNNRHTHTQPFNGPFSGTPRMSRYHKKHSPTHTPMKKKKKDLHRQQGQQGLLDPIKPAYNQSRTDGRLKPVPLTRLWISMPAFLLTVPTDTHNSLLDFMVQGKITEADALTICLDATQSRLLVPPPPLSPNFYVECPFCCDPPNLSWLVTGTE